MGYIYVWENFGGGRHIDAEWSPIQDTYVIGVLSLCLDLLGFLMHPHT